MAAKAMNFKTDEVRIEDIKSVASVFRMTITDVINEALDEYLAKMKKDPFYRLTANVKDASEAESKDVLDAIEELSDDDLAISQVKHFEV